MTGSTTAARSCARSSRRRAAPARRAEGARRPEHPGELRQARSGGHLRGHADERARRGPVRVRHDEPARRRECPRHSQRTPVGKPAMIGSFAASPNGQFVLVEKVKRPFSRLVPWSDFPRGRRDLESPRREDPRGRGRADGRHRPDQRRDDRDRVRIAGCRPSRRRSCGSRRSTRVTSRTTVPFRDRIVTLKAPFAGEPDRSRQDPVSLRGRELDRRRQHHAERSGPEDAQRSARGS